MISNKLDEMLQKRSTTQNAFTNSKKSEEIAKVMIVDDDESMRRGLKTILSEYNVISANDGAQSIELFKENQDIYVIVMDALMPVMDGFQATKQLKKINPEVLIIMHTAYQDQHEISKIVDLGLFGYVTKGSVEITPDGKIILPNVNKLKEKIKLAINKQFVKTT